jgi:NosR/NirI family nitrous oxide reductase transcriptional regulator
MRAVLLCLYLILLGFSASAETLKREVLAALVVPPFALGEPVNEKSVYTILNSGGAAAGYIFETEPLAPMPGFSGAPINVLVTLDLEGRFLDARLLHHNEPIFVSGLGEAPFHAFMEQYRGLSIGDSIVVGTPYGGASAGSSLVYLDGVTKATASVRIAHESIMAAALAVAREKMTGVNLRPPSRPDPAYEEALDWPALVAQGLVRRHQVSNAEVDALFAGTVWADDDAEARAAPDAPYLDLWVLDLGPTSLARAALSGDTFRDLQRFLSVSEHDEPLLVIDTGRHGLVSPGFVRNTAPDWLSAEQGGLPVALRDSDLFVELAEGAPEGVAMILRTDRRLGFDPASPWTLHVSAVRAHGMFQPEIGQVTLSTEIATPERFFLLPEMPRVVPPWREAIRGRQGDLLGLAGFLLLLLPLLYWGQSHLAGHRYFTRVRLAVLALVTGFIGWWGQGQLSIVTVLGVIRAAWEGGSYAFLVYDPFSLLVWGAAILGFFLWGRGLFCGWLCPFGALQEFAHHLGRALRLPRWEPSAAWDARLKSLKYLVLASLIAVVFLAPAYTEKAAEVEPFKTAITTFFLREWYYVAYAAGLLLLSMVTFKGFCRYICPLGAVMAIGGALRLRRWIPRRVECGSPCQLCKVRCAYGAIQKSGAITYTECFQCLDCVTIHDDPAQCVPLVLKAKAQRKVAAR